MMSDEKPEVTLDSNVEDYISMLKLENCDLKELTNVLKSRTNYYREEIAKMEAAFVRLQLLVDGPPIFEECTELLDKLSQLQQKFNTKELTPEALMLSHAHRLRKHNNYAAKLKICIKMYIQMNEVLMKKIRELKCEYKLAQENINKVVTATPDEVKIMEKKISRYEQELIKLEKKYPWLKNPEYDLPNISKEINTLTAARREKDDLLKELSVYHGLKPDLQEASEQLSQIKIEYEEMNRKLLDNNH